MNLHRDPDISVACLEEVSGYHVLNSFEFTSIILDLEFALGLVFLALCLIMLMIIGNQSLSFSAGCIYIIALLVVPLLSQTTLSP